MSHHPSRSPACYLALGCVGFIASAATAQTGTTADQAATQLQGVTVIDDAIEDAVKVDRLESPKATRPLVDTPQTITVIPERVLQQQNLLTLRDALTTIPGITFGAGEGGGGFGDSINLRGYSANSDLLSDGVRDSAQYSRTETFNIQQIEIYNGANSVFNGAGSIGGSINLVQKTPLARDAVTVSAGIGTDDYYRATVDANLRVNDLIAFRLNGVVHRNDYPGRDVERSRRWGIAPSLAIGVDGPTSLIVSYVHQHDDNTPVYGVPYYATATNPGGRLAGVDDSDYFGIVNLDEQKQLFDQATIRFAHAFSDTVSIRNLTRWQRVEANTITSSPQGTFCLASGVTPTGGACTTSFTTNVFYDGAVRTGTTARPFVIATAPGTFLPNGPRGLVRDQENQLLYNQTDFKADFSTGALRHSFVLGVAFTQEDYHLDTGNLPRTAAGVTVIQPPISLTAPDTRYAGPLNFIRGSQAHGDTRNAAVYAFDTIALVPQLELSLGARYEKNRTEFRTDTYSIVVGPTLGAYARGPAQVSDDTLFSYRAGLNFKPTEWSSLYVAYANSRTPRSASVRGGCGTLVAVVGQTGQFRDPCAVAPEKAVNYEIGAKAELFDRRLLLTAALFRNDRTNFSVNTNDPQFPTLPIQDGHSRVDGVALGASGNITDAWALFANYTYLDSEIRQGVSDFCLANPGTGACGNSTAIPDPQRGQFINQTPKHSGSLFTTYAFPFGLQVGYGLTYQGSFALNTPTLLAGTPAGLGQQFRSRDYLIHRAFLSYEVSRGVAVQLNVQNFTDRSYFTGIRNNGWATPGEARSARLALNYSF